MPSLITNLSGYPLTLPEPYVVMLRPGQGVTVSDEPNTVITNLGGSARINGLLGVSLAPQVDSGTGALPAEVGKYAKLSGAAFTGPVGFAAGAAAPVSAVGARPAASAATRGMRWQVEAAGVEDEVQVCVREAAGTFAWKTATLT